MSQWNQSLGRRGEELAASHLKKKGYRILFSRFRTPFGEIDLIAEQGNTLGFFEVKCRRGTTYGSPLEAITRVKLRHLIRATQWFLAYRPRQRERRLTLGAIGILLGKGSFEIREELITDCFEF